MTQTISPQTEWREKAGRAKQLIDEVRALAKAPKDPDAIFDGAEAQVEANNKMAEARKLLDEAKTLREAADAKSSEGQLADLLRDSADLNGDGSDPIIPAGGGSLDGLMNGRSGGHRKEEAKFNPFRKSGNQLVRVGAQAMSHKLISGAIPAEAEDEGRELARTLMRETSHQAIAQREIAALVEGTQSAGGFLVVPQYLQDMFAKVRREGNALRRHGLLNTHQTEETNQILFPKASGSLIVGLVAELAVKPTQDNSYQQVTVGLYTMAGIAGVSRQLARSSDPAVAEILAQDLAALLGNLEEQLTYSGTGSQQPRGIINTSGTTAPPALTTTGPGSTFRAQDLIDAMIDMAARIGTNYYGSPSGAVMRPSRLAFLAKGKDANGNYILNRAGTYREPGSVPDQPNGTVDLLGIPLLQSTNIPSNLGSGTNQDAVIMADWNEAHWFQRWDQQLDSSDIASDGAGVSAFATNRVLFRLEEIAGFTAERYPAAFCVLTDPLLVSAY